MYMLCLASLISLDTRFLPKILLKALFEVKILQVISTVQSGADSSSYTLCINSFIFSLINFYFIHNKINKVYSVSSSSGVSSQISFFIRCSLLRQGNKSIKAFVIKFELKFV